MIANYDYTGPFRLRRKTLGETSSHARKNASYLAPEYDDLRRVLGYGWYDQANQKLTGHEYDYDDVGNPLFERFRHDEDRYDNYNYDSLYQLTNVRFRDSGSEDYRTSSVTWTAGTYERFLYDHNFNRTGDSGNKVITQDPMGNEAAIQDYYAANSANEYTAINRGGSGVTVAHDKAGNMTQIPVIPGSGVDAGSQVTNSIDWDGFNRSYAMQAGSNQMVHIRHDAFGRRVAIWDAESGEDLDGRRFIWDGWSEIQERLFTDYLDPDFGEPVMPTEDNAHSKPERVYVLGPSIDEPILVAIDGDLDGFIGGEEFEATSLNKAEYTHNGEEPVEAEDRFDFAYYYLNNRMGSIMALLARDLEPEITPPGFEAEPKARILEYYRYSAYGSATILPVHDHGTDYGLVSEAADYDGSGEYPGSGSNGEWDLIEDTPLTLTDNNALMLARREGEGGYESRGDSYGRVSQFGNHYTFTARRWDADTGLMYYRYRYYETTSGRFVERDPIGYSDGYNGFQFVHNMPAVFRDPDGFAALSGGPLMSVFNLRVLYTVLERSARLIGSLPGGGVAGTASPVLAHVTPAFSATHTYMYGPGQGYIPGPRLQFTTSNVYAPPSGPMLNIPHAQMLVPPDYNEVGPLAASDVTRLPGRRGALFSFRGTFAENPANANVLVDCGIIQQFIRWSKHDESPGSGHVDQDHAWNRGGPYAPNTWHEDRQNVPRNELPSGDWRYGHRTGPHAGIGWVRWGLNFNHYFRNGAVNMVSGPNYEGADFPSIGANVAWSSHWEFRLVGWDDCNQQRLAYSRTLIVNW